MPVVGAGFRQGHSGPAGIWSVCAPVPPHPDGGHEQHEDAGRDVRAMETGKGEEGASHHAVAQTEARVGPFIGLACEEEDSQPHGAGHARGESPPMARAQVQECPMGEHAARQQNEGVDRRNARVEEG